jgi:hypothetical protein
MIQGKAIIELFDKETGERVYKQEHKNIITNAYKNIINPNVPLGIGFTNSYHFSLSTITPLATKMFGGILLFSENKEADADNFMITKDDYYNFVGNAGSAWGGESIFRGSFNPSESGPISETEYKLTWDFPSNASNGKIKCISLCPRYLGDNGLIKDKNDTSMTNLIQMIGQDLGEASKMYDNSYGCQYFHRHKTTDYGYYLYSRDDKTNVYARSSGTSIYFTEITKKNYLGLDEYVNNSYASSLNLEDTNLYNISDSIILDYSEESSIQNARYFQYYQGYIYFVNHSISGGTITFKVFKIDSEDYTKVDTKTYTVSISGFNKTKVFPRYINNKIYFTTYNNFLYILDLEDETFKTIEIPETTYFDVIKWYDTVALITRDSHESITPIYILDSKDNLCFNKLYFASSDSSYPIFEKVHTNNECLNYPLSNTTSLYYHSSTGYVEYENQALLPFVCSINNVDEFTKNSSNTMKITYILKEY